MRIRDSLHDDRLPNTYYTASCNDLDVYRRLEGNTRTQVCIVGGGFTGVSTAIELTERGYDVALVEQNQIGWGASGRSGGHIFSGPTDIKRYENVFGVEVADKIWRLGASGPQIVKDRIAKYSIECDLTWGGLEIARTASELAGLQARISSLQLRGMEGVKLLSADETANYIVAENINGALVRPDWGHCQPLNLVRGAARAAENLGARIYEDARVERISYGEQIIVDTGHGKVTADKLVFSGNAYLGGLEPRLAKIISPAGCYMVASAPLEQDAVEAMFPHNLAVRGQGDTHSYFHRSADNRVLFALMNLQTGKHPRNVEKALWPKLTELFPILKNYKCDYAWGGFVAASENQVPQAGKLGENVYYAQAYSASGISESHIAGKIITEAIDGDSSYLDMISAVEHVSFGGQSAVGRLISSVKRGMGLGK